MSLAKSSSKPHPPPCGEGQGGGGGRLGAHPNAPLISNPAAISDPYSCPHFPGERRGLLPRPARVAASIGPGSTAGEVLWWGKFWPAGLPPPCGEGTRVGVATDSEFGPPPPLTLPTRGRVGILGKIEQQTPPSPLWGGPGRGEAADSERPHALASIGPGSTAGEVPWVGRGEWARASRSPSPLWGGNKGGGRHRLRV